MNQRQRNIIVPEGLYKNKMTNIMTCDMVQSIDFALQ